MPKNYLIEMVCDRVAASMIYLGKNYTDKAPLEYYQSHKDENQFSDYTRFYLEEYLTNIANYGFDTAMKSETTYKC